MPTVVSPDISNLELKVTFDISGANPSVSVLNLSSGTGMANLSWWFDIISPTNTFIKEGSSSAPDATGTWTTKEFVDSWPKPMRQIEWSGPAYTFVAHVKDSLGKIFTITKSAVICRPNGNTSKSSNAYGVSSMNLIVQCESARIFFEDTTDTSYYQNITGTQVSSSLIVMYPVNEGGVIPEPFAISSFTKALVPISYGSDAYQYLAKSVYEYDLGDNVFVRIGYQSKDAKGNAAVRFSVMCNVDLSVVVCELAKLSDSISNGTCENVTIAQEKLNRITPLLLMAMIGQSQPLSGGDNVPKLIDQIIEIGGFDCNCCDLPAGILPNSSSLIDGYVFDIVPDGGDVSGSVARNGNNIHIKLKDKTYVFAIAPYSATNNSTAFSVASSVSGDVKTFLLSVDARQLATDLGNVIKADATLLNFWRTMLAGSPSGTGGGGVSDLIVDGGCIFQSTSTCDYDFGLSQIPASTTYALITSIKIKGVVKPLSHAFNLTSLPGLQAYLNALGYGTFVVSQPSPNPSGVVNISTDLNPNQIESITYKKSSSTIIAIPTLIATMTKECTGFIARKAQEVVQDIIDYMCALDDKAVSTSADYIVKWADQLGDIQSTTVPKGAGLNALIEELLEAGNSNVQYFADNSGGVNCESIKELFAPNAQVINASDLLYGTRAGGCAGMTFLDVFNYQLRAGINSSFTKELFCAFVSACGNGVSGLPNDYFEVFVTPYDQACTEIVGIEYTLT